MAGYRATKYNRIGFSDHVIGVAAAVSDPGFGFRAEFDLFLLAIRTSAASGLEPANAHAVTGPDGTDTGANRIDFADGFMSENVGSGTGNSPLKT
jgi:hypothetical protein